ncbi:hypothetical protein HaLaN_08019 [Haematococcus lacustris]|uniref:Uncharacterized protein n=1 Tax=Haematococcus lacustris TaxID=44745 RepID=A0A699YQC9_HAELA|nr:hypothetical protein HaLaN_08019 [Haematococcus lacustris]
MRHCRWSAAGATAADGWLPRPQQHLQLRPCHLPPCLTSLDVSNVRFSPEWESDAATHQLPRLTSLTLVSTGGCWAVASATHPTTSAAGLEDNTQPVATAITLQGPGPSYEEQGRRADQQDHQPGQTPDQQDQAVLCPTLISNWHLLYVVGRQPMLSHLRLCDLWTRGPGAGWRTLPERSKLKARGVALLGRLPYLTSLQLQPRSGGEKSVTLVCRKHQGVPIMCCASACQLTGLQQLGLEYSYNCSTRSLAAYIERQLQPQLPCCAIRLAMSEDLT